MPTRPLLLQSGAIVLTRLALLGFATACTGQAQRFPLEAPRWRDNDENHVAHQPKDYYSGMLADAADKSFFLPLARAPYLPLGNRAQNVNALDEVPNSSWFENRLGFFDLTPEEIARAACGTTPPLDPNEKWEVIAAKPNGAYPGFFIRAGEDRYLLKFDSPVQPGRATSADVIGSKLYWAVGYHTPCNEIVYFNRNTLTIAKGATAEDAVGHKHPITQKDIQMVLAKAYRTKSGLLRASASRFLPGRPLGPFRYEGQRSDDPNDHVPHQNRRELRANRILSAWLHHHDAREQNTLDVWLSGQGREKNVDFIRHYMIDFGDCLGSRWAFDPLSRRFGYSYFVSFDQAAVDLVTLGAYPRPWHDLTMNPHTEIFGTFNVKDFYPATWVTEYPNSAFSEIQYDDALWMARILARFSREQVGAAVQEAKLYNESAETYLLDTLMGRRDKILATYFTKYAPLDRFTLIRRDPPDLIQSLCFEDIAIASGVANAASTTYKIRYYGGSDQQRELGWLQFQPDPKHPGRSCIRMELGEVRASDLAPPNAPDDDPLRYSVLKIWIHQRVDLRPTSAIHLYFYDFGAKRGLRLVGISRPDRPATPELY